MCVRMCMFYNTAQEGLKKMDVGTAGRWRGAGESIADVFLPPPPYPI